MTESGDPREVELKLRLPPEAVPRLMKHRLLRQLAKRGPVRQHLVSTYFDTPDFRLMQAQVALRIRKIGRRHVQTVKCAPDVKHGLNSRSEWEREIGGDQLSLKDVGNKRLRKLLTAGKIRDRLAPQFVTDVKRATWPIKLNGSSVELAIDVGEIKSSKGRVPVCEAEFELKSGPVDGIYALARELHKSVPFSIEPLSKAERGFALVANVLPKSQRAKPLELERDCTIADAFRSIGRSCLFHLRANEAALRPAPTPEAIHQFRVAVRRLRSALTAFGALLPKGVRRRITGEMRWIAQRFGHARDWDVFHGALLREVREHLSADGSLVVFSRAVKAARGAAYQAVTETIASPRYTDSLLRMEAWWEGGAWMASLGDEHDEPARDFARRVLKKLHRRLHKLGDRLDRLSESELHEMRKQAKKLRYAAEFFHSLFPAKVAKAYIRSLAEVQERLGSLNDGVTAKQLLAELEKRKNGMDQTVLARATGIISGWSAARLAQDLKRLPDAWARFADHKPFWK